MITALLSAKRGCKTKDIWGPAPFPSEAKHHPDESDEQDHATVSPHPGREPGPSFSNPSWEVLRYLLQRLFHDQNI